MYSKPSPNHQVQAFRADHFADEMSILMSANSIFDGFGTDRAVILYPVILSCLGAPHA